MKVFLRRISAILLLSVCISGSLFAFNFKKEQEVQGSVQDARTQQPIVDAKVIYEGGPDGKLRYEASTDVNGKYVMPGNFLTAAKESWQYKVTITVPFYKSAQEEVAVPFMNNQPFVKNFLLNRDLQFQVLSGSVLDGVDQSPVSGVHLRIVNRDFRTDYSCTTDAKGQYAFPRVTVDPDANKSSEYELSIQVNYYLTNNETIAVFKKEGEVRHDLLLQRDIRKRDLRGVLKDKVTGEPLVGKVKLYSYNERKESEFSSDVQGQFNVTGGVSTDAMPQRAWRYKVEASVERYDPQVKDLVLVYATQAEQVDFLLEKTPLAAPTLIGPVGKTMALKPECTIQIPAKVLGEMNEIEITIEQDQGGKKVFQKTFADPNCDAKGIFRYILGPTEALAEGTDYLIHCRFKTKNGFMSLPAKSAFSIPSSDTLNPPFPEQVLTADELDNIHPAWVELSGGVQLLFASNRGEEAVGAYQIWRARIGAAGVTKVTSSISGSNDLYPLMGPGSKQISFVSNRVGNVMNLWSVPAEGAKLMTQRTAFNNGEVRYPTASADGEYMAYSRRAASGKTTTIWTQKSNGTEQTQLCQGDMPSYSPDGRYILYVSDLSGSQDIWRIGADGVGKTQVTNSEEVETYPAWVDSNRILYASNKAGSFDIWMLDMSTGVKMQLTNNLADELMPACEPNGSQVAYVSNRGGSNNIYLINISSIIESASGSRLQKQ